LRIERSVYGVFGVVSELKEFVSKERKERNQEFAGYQDCSGYDGCVVAVISSV
jgi:hypothetical protein